MTKKPNIFVWLFFGAILKIYAFFLGLKITKKDSIQGPAFVLSNHTSFSDYIYTTSTLYPHRITYLAASKMFYEPIRGPFLKLARAIPKAMFQSDYRAIKQTFEILKQKGLVGIYPEGQLSYHGTSLRPPYGIAKLIKKAKVAVYVVQIQNAYLRNPPWTEKTFKGKVFATLKKVLTPELIALLTEEEIFLKVNEALYFNTGDFNKQHRHSYQVQPIQGLEKLLFECPKCHHEGLKAQQNQLVCPQCQNTLMYDQYGLLNGRSVYEWFEDQRQRFEKKCNQKGFQLTTSVRLVRYQGKVLKPVGEGTLTLNKDQYIYHGTDQGKEKTYTFLTKVIEYLPADIGKNVQIYDQNEAYIFEMSPMMSTQFFMAGEYFYRLAHGLVQ